MPIIKGKVVSPDEALAQDHCPECGEDFAEHDPFAHRLQHWHAQPPLGPDGDEARRRIAAYDAYLRRLRERPVVTAGAIGSESAKES